MPSLYVHVPFCIQKCDYCAFYSHALMDTPKELIPLYLEGLEVEMDMRQKDAPQGVSSLFIGGGTPTALKGAELEQLLGMIHQYFRINLEAEKTIEGNPGTLSVDKLTILRRYGINRFSLGVQSFDDRLLQAVGRLHSARQAREAIQGLRAAGFTNLNLDLMFGLPGQDMVSWQASVEEALAYSPEHLSFYGLMLEEGTPLYRRYIKQEGLARLDLTGIDSGDQQREVVEYTNRIELETGPSVDRSNILINSTQLEVHRLPDDELQAEMYEWAIGRLKRAGYRQYETSNFALPGYECQHNLGYWRGEDYLGLGPGGVSCLERVRWKSIEDVRSYANLLLNEQSPIDDENREVLSLRECMAERMILGLRLEEGVNLSSFRKDFGVDPRDIYRDVLEGYQGDVFILHEDFLCLNPKFAFVANSVLEKFV